MPQSMLGTHACLGVVFGEFCMQKDSGKGRGTAYSDMSTQRPVHTSAARAKSHRKGCCRLETWGRGQPVVVSKYALFYPRLRLGHQKKILIRSENESPKLYKDFHRSQQRHHQVAYHTMHLAQRPRAQDPVGWPTIRISHLGLDILCRAYMKNSKLKVENVAECRTHC